MPIAIKYVLAGLLLAGVSVVWLPRLTGFDPLAWLSRGEPEPDYSYSIDAPVDELLPTEEEPVATRVEDLPAKELEQIVSFLESRNLAGEPEVSPVQPIVPVVDAHPGHEQEQPSEQTESLQTLEAFLARNPLNAILIGKGRGKRPVRSAARGRGRRAARWSRRGALRSRPAAWCSRPPSGTYACPCLPPGGRHPESQAALDHAQTLHTHRHPARA